jgi:hypothetical protein
MTCRTKPHPILLLCSLLLVMLFAAPARAATVEDAEHHFSYTLPSGWTDFTDTEMAKINAKRSIWIHGGRSDSGAYFLVTTGALPETPDGPGQTSRYRAELQHDEPGVDIESVTWDARRNAYVSQLGIAKGGNTLHVMCFVFPGPAERIKFYCYPDGTDITPVVPDLYALADTFAFDDPTAAARPHTTGGHSTGLIIMSVLLSAVCFLMFLLIAGTLLFAILRKRKAANP